MASYFVGQSLRPNLMRINTYQMVCGAAFSYKFD